MYFKDIIIESVVTSIIGIICYCIIEACGNNIIVAFCDGTQNRINIDLKVVIFATYLVAFSKLWLFEKRERNLWTSMCLKVIFATFIYILVVSIFTYSNLFFKFILLIFSITLSQVIEKVTLRYFKTSATTDEVFKYINILFILCFAIYSILR